MEEMQKGFKLLHVATVAQSLYYFLDGQARYMQEQGANVHCVSSPGELLELFSEREDVPVHGIEMARAISPFKDLVSLWRLCRLIKELRPDIVHAHTPKGGLLGMISAFLMRVPVRVYNVHGLPHVTATGFKYRLLCLTEKISCALAHRVFCVSVSLAAQVRDEKLSSHDKVQVIHNGSINGVDALVRFDPEKHDAGSLRDSLDIPRTALVVGFVGRLVKDKGIMELIASWDILREKFSDLHLLLVGPFEDKDSIPVAAKQKLESDERIHLIGHVDDPAPYYAVMDVLSFPTHREGFGLVAIEASAMRVPVVATCIPGCVDSVSDGVTGTLVPKCDADALEKALSTYLVDPLLRSKHGVAGRKRVLEDFQPSTIWKDLHNEYIDLLNVK
ncbi:glycosyltransferase family 4 protein [Geothermobacter hydrogeniphilus]|uniref:Glycosyltransferase subfamily 4-like N-terminal domain-containing protein n=1 Tax=Geothermobacter hydrogeniphilus TaxID=1969733 RepID=A0A1X0XSQ0_9BACT|nr:glycosyltransferase family 4 protein [Geothermobacter hydrogeniphilus]ORJ55878.1 hypothetical protein B5V00_14880 [Geothermobacter hydrogeniphilus]